VAIADPQFLVKFGWDDFFASQNAALITSTLRPGRVISEERGLYRVQWALEESCWATVSGKLQFSAAHREDYPAVGDWVLMETPSASDRGTIHLICPRKSVLHRRQVGSSGDKQILSTNVDYVFITTSVNDELNHRRIERYLTIANDSSVTAVILLTKADIFSEAKAVLEIAKDTQEKFPGVPVHTLSKNEFEKAAFLEDYLQQGKTAVVIGSSGVGKSTLVNFLIGHEQIKTQDIRESDGRGRHTTTSRALYPSRFGGMIIDTPGMRELQLSEHVDGIKTHFDDIEELIAKCRFSDCKHHTEPGCAINAALKTKTLEDSRWKNFLKLAAEVKTGVQKMEKNAVEDQRRAWKKASFLSKNKNRNKNES
jgi:ribosome biogenesis GTPase